MHINKTNKHLNHFSTVYTETQPCIIGSLLLSFTLHAELNRASSIIELEILVIASMMENRTVSLYFII